MIVIVKHWYDHNDMFLYKNVQKHRELATKKCHKNNKIPAISYETRVLQSETLIYKRMMRILCIFA
jgi:hypothetical protein